MKNVKLKTKLSEAEVRHIAKLARLTLTANEIGKFQKQLSEILDYVAILKKVDTTRVDPTSQVTGLENVFRNDKVAPCLPAGRLSLSPKEVLSGSKKTHRGFFKVKAILS